MFLFCRPFVVNTTFSTGLVSFEVTSVSWLWVGSCVLSLFPSFSLPDVLCDPTDLIRRKWTPFEAMTDRTAPSSDGLLAEGFGGFLDCKVNARRSVHSPQDHFIITLVISDRRDTRVKWPLATGQELLAPPH